MDLRFVVSGTNLVPADEETHNEMQKWRSGETVHADFKRMRNPQFHRKFFSLCKTVFDSQEHFEDFDIFRKWLTMKCGFFDTVVTPANATIFLPQSISFGKMSQDEFEKLYSKAIDVSLKEFGIDEEIIRRVIDYA